MFKTLFDQITGYEPVARKSKTTHREVALGQDVLFYGLSHEEINVLMQYMSRRKVAADDLIFYEGKSANNLYIIQEGAIEVFKGGGEIKEHRLAILEDGDCFGEMSLFDEKKRSASIRAILPTSLLVLNKEDLESLGDLYPGIKLTLIRNLSTGICNHLRNTNEITVKSLETQIQRMNERVKMGIFMTYVILLLACYALMNSFSGEYAQTPTMRLLINFPFLSFAAFIILLMMRNLPYPLKLYGLSLQNWKKPVAESIVWTAGFLGLLFFFKLFSMEYLGWFEGTPLISNPLDKIDLTANIFVLIGRGISFAAFIPMQELIIRSGLQSSLMQFLPHTRSYRWFAIIITTTVFAAIHSHLSVTLGMSLFLPGFFLSILYARNGSLIAVCISHMLIVLISYYVLGITELTSFT